MPDSTKIAYVGRELGGKATAWWHGFRTTGKLLDTWIDFVTIFKGQFLQPPSRTEAMNLSRTRSRSEVEGSRLFGRIGNIPLDLKVF